MQQQGKISTSEYQDASAQGLDLNPGHKYSRINQPYIFDLVKQELEKTPLVRLGAALVAPALRGVARRIDYTEIGGALLAGVARPVVIAHGRSDAHAIESAIRAAASFAERDLPGALAASL